jgi:hypothetical protein
MTRPLSHWADSELPEPLMRVLESAEPGDSDAAAIERMGTRLEISLGPAFDAKPAGPSAWHSPSSQLKRVLAIGMGTIAAASITCWSLRPSTLPHPFAAHAAVSASQQLTAADALPLQETPAREPVACEAEVSASAPQPAAHSEATSAANSAKHRDRDRRSRAAAAPGLAEELHGLGQIRALLSESPKRALAAADEQQQRFARGALSPERELLRLDALLRLGRDAQAQQLAAQLTAAPENHPYRTRIAELLARGL